MAVNEEPDFTSMRRWKRHDFDVRVRAAVNIDGSVRTVYGRGTDLSSGGMAAFLAIELAKGQNVEIDVTMPYSSQPMKLKAVVCNRSGYRYGLEFFDISPGDRKLIERTCSALEFIQ